MTIMVNTIKQSKFTIRLQNNPKNVYALYNKACSLSLPKKYTESLEVLKKAIELSPALKKKAREDKDFDNLRAGRTSGPRFAELVKD
jgi:tetratricopeptide (TPR) repeat protein